MNNASSIKMLWISNYNGRVTINIFCIFNCQWLVRKPQGYLASKRMKQYVKYSYYVKLSAVALEMLCISNYQHYANHQNTYYSKASIVDQPSKYLVYQTTNSTSTIKIFLFQGIDSTLTIKILIILKDQ